MKKFFLVLVAVAFLSPSFAEEKDKGEHSASDKKAESSESKSSGRSEKEAAGKGDLSKKLDACLKARPETDSKK